MVLQVRYSKDISGYNHTMKQSVIYQHQGWILAYLYLFLQKLRIQSGKNWGIYIRTSDRYSSTIFNLSSYNKNWQLPSCVSCVRTKNICFRFFVRSLAINSFDTWWHNCACDKQPPDKKLLPNILRELWPVIPTLASVAMFHGILIYWFLRWTPSRNTCFRTFASQFLQLMKK